MYEVTSRDDSKVTPPKGTPFSREFVAKPKRLCARDGGDRSGMKSTKSMALIREDLPSVMQLAPNGAVSSTIDHPRLAHLRGEDDCGLSPTSKEGKWAGCLAYASKRQESVSEVPPWMGADAACYKNRDPPKALEMATQRAESLAIATGTGETFLLVT